MLPLPWGGPKRLTEMHKCLRRAGGSTHTSHAMESRGVHNMRRDHTGRASGKREREGERERERDPSHGPPPLVVRSAMTSLVRLDLPIHGPQHAPYAQIEAVDAASVLDSVRRGRVIDGLLPQQRMRSARRRIDGQSLRARGYMRYCCCVPLG